MTEFLHAIRSTYIIPCFSVSFQNEARPLERGRSSTMMKSRSFCKSCLKRYSFFLRTQLRLSSTVTWASFDVSNTKNESCLHLESSPSFSPAHFLRIRKRRRRSLKQTFARRLQRTARLSTTTTTTTTTMYTSSTTTQDPVVCFITGSTSHITEVTCAYVVEYLDNPKT